MDREILGECLSIQKISITELSTDAIVNAANEDLLAGGGVCGAIFRAAGYGKLQAACDAIGHCDTGDAVATYGYGLNVRYIIHAVGPVWYGGQAGEPEKLYSAYRRSLEVAAEKGCHTIGFPLISAGIYGYPVPGAWEQAIAACLDFLRERPETDLRIVFAVLDDKILRIGQSVLAMALAQEEEPAFRFANENDCARILSFIRQLAVYEGMADEVVATEELLREWIFEKKKAEVLFACENGKEVGFALFFHNFSTFLGRAGIYLEDLFVLPEYRGKGYGTGLLKQLAKIACDRGCGRLEWACLDWNTPSIRLYRSLGAQPMDEWTTYRLTGQALWDLAGKETSCGSD